VTCEVIGPELSARHYFESLEGLEGSRVEQGEDLTAARNRELVSLSTFLGDLAGGPRWEGAQEWQSFGGDLRVAATCDPLGHVTLTLTVARRTYKPATSWSTTITVVYALGDLGELARELDAWVTSQRAARGT